MIFEEQMDWKRINDGLMGDNDHGGGDKWRGSAREVRVLVLSTIAELTNRRSSTSLGPGSTFEIAPYRN
jgi:hypothetical protein